MSISKSASATPGGGFFFASNTRGPHPCAARTRNCFESCKIRKPATIECRRTPLTSWTGFPVLESQQNSNRKLHAFRRPSSALTRHGFHLFCLKRNNLNSISLFHDRSRHSPLHKFRTKEVASTKKQHLQNAVVVVPEGSRLPVSHSGYCVLPIFTPRRWRPSEIYHCWRFDLHVVIASHNELTTNG